MTDWEGLNHDLLVLISKRIKLIEDFDCFRLVSKSWMEAACKRNLRPQIPRLMLAEKNGDDRRQIYSISEDKMSKKSVCIPPEMANRKCIGLNYGWILTISRCGKMNLVNPVSRSHIELPNQKSIQDYDQFETWPEYGFTARAALSANPSESSCDFVVMIVHSGGSYLGYWRRGDKAWTRIENEDGRNRYGYYDVIYYKDQFYALASEGHVWAYTISGPPRQITWLCDSRLVIQAEVFLYLVESPSGLLIVARQQELRFEEIIRVEGLEDDGVALGEDQDYGSNYIRVYELDLINGGQWKQIKNLGDMAIFVGHNTSISFNEASEFHGIKSNYIYFTDDYEECYVSMVSGGGSDMGSYSLEDDQIKKFNVGRSLSRISPPFWFIPSY